MDLKYEVYWSEDNQEAFCWHCPIDEEDVLIASFESKHMAERVAQLINEGEIDAF